MQQLQTLGIAVDHGVYKKNTFFISDFSEYEINKLNQNGFSYEVLIDDVSSFYQNRTVSGIKRNALCLNETANVIVDPTHFQLGSMAGFYTYNELLSILDEMRLAFPNLISEKAQIGSYLSHEGRPIYYVKISDNPENDEVEPEILYSAIHHAREPGSMISTIYYMWYLLENYDNNVEIKRLVDESEMYFIPLLNPDGYVYNETTNPNGGGPWRKNRRNNNDGTYGVDLNRNYSYDWGTTGISFDTDSDVYPGTGPFSEPETQAMKWFCEQRDFLFAYNAHTFSNLMLFPIGSQVDLFAEDHDYFQSIANEMVLYNGFVAQKSSSLYPASGDSDDYMYLEDLSIKPKIYAFTPEIGSDEDGFWPTIDRIIPLCQDMLHSNLTLVRAAHHYWLIKENNPQSLTELNGNFQYEVKRLGLIDQALQVSLLPYQNVLSTGNSNTHQGLVDETITASISYQLNQNLETGDTIKFLLKRTFNTYEITDTIVKIFGTPPLQILENGDQFENWSGNWELSSTEFVSPSSSFTESAVGEYNNDVNKVIQYLPTIDLSNSSAVKIEFFAKWSIENNYDYCSFEVSLDSGLTWIPQCGKYTNSGTSANGSVQPEGKPIYDDVQNDWVLEEISLNDYVGEKIHVRFLFASDGGVKDDGFYFDDFKVYYNSSNNSIKNLENNKLVNIFPNPSNGELIISAENMTEQSTLMIFDVNGRIVFESELEAPYFVKKVPIYHLDNGSYLVQLSTNDHIVHRENIILMK
ncbi:MAG: immune inhibitor A [Flavobacteriia bacterium]|nr:immune inhibitor A [Flavobacteriia bacterium]